MVTEHVLVGSDFQDRVDNPGISTKAITLATGPDLGLVSDTLHGYCSKVIRKKNSTQIIIKLSAMGSVFIYS